MPRSALRLAALMLLAAGPLFAQSPGDALKAVEFRSIGPTNMGGRTTDVDGIPGDPKTFYVSGADGGILMKLDLDNAANSK